MFQNIVDVEKEEVSTQEEIRTDKKEKVKNISIYFIIYAINGKPELMEWHHLD